MCERVLNELPRNLNYLVHIRCRIPRSVAIMEVNTDKAALDMSKVHENELLSNVFVVYMDVIPPSMPEVDNNNHLGH